MGRRLEKLDFHWFEEPLADYDLYGDRTPARDPGIPIAAGEDVQGGVRVVPQMPTMQAVDIKRSDVSWKSGITGLLKTAHLCEAFGVNREIHTTTLSPLEIANLHVARAIPDSEDDATVERR